MSSSAQSVALQSMPKPVLTPRQLKPQ